MAGIDPITLATVWHSFQTLVREMRDMVTRTSQSYLMSQLKDVSVGIWLADGSTVAMPQGLLCQFMGTKFAIRAVREHFGDDLNPGDVILTNDPYKGMTVHLPDWGFIRPIFFEGELLFFTLVRGHQQDTGGSFPGGYFPNSYDIHAEGLCIPPTKVFERDRERADVMRLIWNNVRWPEAVRVDNYAMVATSRFAENRIHHVLRRYGKDTVMACIAEMLARTERAVRAEIAAIPDGTYSGEAATDDDGTILDEPVWVRVDITVKGDDLTVDFSRSDAQRKGFVNCPFAASYAIAVGSMMLLFDPALADFHNEGSLRPITVIAPPGSVVNPQYPATVGAAPVNVGHQIATSVGQALSKARPDRAMASWGKRRGDYVSSVDPRSGQPYVRTTFDYDGSAGAVTGHDGPTGPLSIGSLATVMRSNAEEMEIRFPWRLLKWEAATDLMGAGRWRGGGGVEWRALNVGADGRMATGSSDGDSTPGPGAQGGGGSPCSRTFLLREGQPIRVKPHRMVEIKKGDVVVKISGGGGGVGMPFERPAELVALDVRNGMVSLDCARRIYGVAVDPASFAVDEAETRRLRSKPPEEWDVVINEKTLAVELVPSRSE
ncbi:MAG: hydantoinase B/oxoprolinase family protein [Betaproteobacteria bacterium]|nr:hydantoinase B/oxoprolinase family protein [Betaproteobacteria bacterium]